MKEGRTHFRQSLRTSAWVADPLVNTWTPIDLLDISEGGAAFISKEALQPGSSRVIRFQLPGNPHQISIVMQIVHSKAHTFLAGFRVGAKFARIAPGDWALIVQFIKDSTSV